MLIEYASPRLTAGGFTRMRADDIPAAVYVRPGDPVVCVILAERAEDFRDKPGQMDRIVRALTSALEQQSGKPVRTLVIAGTDNPGADRGLTQGESSVWLFGPGGQRIVFDNQPAEFFGVEKLLAEKPDREAVRRSRAERTKTASAGRAGRFRGKNFPAVTVALAAVCIVIQVIVAVQEAVSADGVSTLLNAIDLPVFLFAKEISGAVVFRNSMYRLLTAVFAHYGWRHLVNNMIALIFLGSAAERLAGRWKYLISYLVSGVGANIISVLWYLAAEEYNVSTAGASGAIFGIAGLLLVWVLSAGRKAGRRNIRSILLMMALMIYQGFAEQGVNNVAHISGAAIGALCGAVICLPKRKESKS
ncbi:MAG: rhomboid family intramembrane serine protease [Lachnospiraceae bacterium]|jgi:rhomboid protease GluP